MEAFTQLVAGCNQELGSEILSPYTITLGDEFQGVAASLGAALRTIFCLEEESLRAQLAFRLRYVVHYGEIDSPLNPVRAHAMVGPGLTTARKLLGRKRKKRWRFLFELDDSFLARQLNRIFVVIQSIEARWKPEDYVFIADMLANENNSEVASLHEKNRGQIWKRRKHLQIEDYRALKNVSLDLARV